jgi:hypothetical protein
MEKVHLSFETLAKQVRESAALAQNPANRVFPVQPANAPKKEAPTIPVISSREEKPPRFRLPPDRRLENLVPSQEVKASELIRKSA